jgi:hypothetical protein
MHRFTLNLPCSFLIMVVVFLPVICSGQSNWNRKPSGTLEYLSDAAYGDGVFVVVGENGVILTSADGNSWSPAASGTSMAFRAVVYAAGTFVVAGEAGTILTSTDGSTWTSRTSGTLSFLSGLTYGNGLFVVVGGGGTILTSADGISWSFASSLTSSFLQAVHFDAGLFVAAGSRGTMRTSTNGLTWSAVTLPTTSFLTAVGHFKGNFLAAGQNGLLFSSPDGVTWSFQNSGTFNWLRSMTQDGVTAVMCGESGTLLTSTDGLSWSAAASGVTTILSGVVFADDKFMVVGEAATNSGVILVSERDGGFRWSVDTSSVSENDGSVLLSIERLGGTAAAATVDFQTVEGSALSGVDFTATSGTASFAVGDSVVEVSIPVANNPEVEPLELFTVELMAPSPAALNIYDSGVVTVNIVDAQDSDADGLLDSWEITHFGSVGLYGPGDDPDNDQNSNLVEFGDGTIPSDPNSANYRLSVTVVSGQGQVLADPDLVTYPTGTTVTLTPVGTGDFVFDGWSGDVAGNAAPLVFTSTGDLNIGAAFSVSLADALDDDCLEWVVSGTGPAWTGQGQTTFDGSDAAEAGGLVIGQQSSLEATVYGPAEVSFRWKVSTSNFDSFRFFIDGSPRASSAGEADWSQNTFFVGAGSHTVKWTYAKNSTASGGSNQAWLDDIVVTYDFPTWKKAYFSVAEQADPNVSGALADADGDEINNLLEFVLGLHPKVADSDSPNIPTLTSNKITWTRHKKRAAHVTVIVESSETLAPGSWVTVFQPVTVESEAGALETVSVTDTQATRRFYRLSASLQP